MGAHGRYPTESETRLGTWLRDKYRLDAVLGAGGIRP
jgi:hypothetical protein